jgi:hypothetical protein
MPSYDLERYLFDLKNDPELQINLRAGKTDLTRYRLNDAERRAIAEMDVVALWRMGVHPLLLVPFSRFAGMSAPDYYARLRAAGAHSQFSSGTF